MPDLAHPPPTAPARLPPSGTAPAQPAMLWDVFCRVIDNHGDLGVCWRLACHLAGLGHRVRLWVDDASALAWMFCTATTALLAGVGGAARPGGNGSCPGLLSGLGFGLTGAGLESGRD